MEESWWCINSVDLKAALERVEEGERAVDVFLDLYTQARVEQPT